MNFLNAENDSNTMAWRSFLIAVRASTVGLAWLYVQKGEPVHAEAAAAGLPKSVTIVEFSDSGERSPKNLPNA
jgi:hypothetical protein